MPMPLMGALSFASRVVPGAGAFELSRSSRRNRVALNVRKSPVAALNARPETRWTDPRTLRHGALGGRDFEDGGSRR